MKSESLIALQHPNFRLLWIGQFISTTGARMQYAGLLWHVTLLVPDEHKGLALGLVGLVDIVPVFVFSAISGAAADSLDRRKLLLLTQVVMTAIAAVMATVTFGGLATVWPIYLFSALSAAAGAFDNPARVALLPNLVPRQHLPNAISLNIIVYQAAAVLGPTLAGLVIANLDIGWIYALNALSFLGVIIALLLMRRVSARAVSDTGTFNLAAVVEGFRFVFREPLIRSTMLLDFFANFFSSAYLLLPIFAQDVLRVGAQGYGWLYAAPSAGALVSSALMVRLVDRVERRGLLLVWSVAVYGLATVVFGLSRSFWLTFACLAFTGAADTVSMVLRNIVRQLATPDRLRGRMTGVNMIFVMGGPHLGELEAGLAANWVGAPLSVITGGLACLLATAWVVWQSPVLLRFRKEAGPIQGARAIIT